MPPSSLPSPGSIALDQWRGFALLLVLASHAFFSTNRVNGLGRIGVNLFFFISGILVYRSLGKEGRAFWDSAKSFWWRRFRRLYPALVAFLIALCALVALVRCLPHPPVEADLKRYFQMVPWALVFAINYAPSDRMATGLWSLACEMQFYVIAPLIMFLGGRSQGRKFLVFGSLALLLLALGLSYPLRAHHLDASKYHFEIAVWPMMLGFFCEFFKRWFLQLPLALVKAVTYLSWTALAIMVAFMLSGFELKKQVVAVGAFLLCPCLLDYLFGRPFGGKHGDFLRWIGERTYSIYLWQEPLTVTNLFPPVWHPLGAVAAIFVGAGWFRLFEKPFLSAGRSASIEVSDRKHLVSDGAENMADTPH